MTAAKVKSLIVDVLARVPWLRMQRLLAAIVRFIWPGFRGA